MTQVFWGVTPCYWVNCPSLTLADEGTTIHQKCQKQLSQQQSMTYPEDTNV